MSADNNSSNVPNSLPPMVTPMHGSLLSSTPQRGCEFFPRLEGEESWRQAYDAHEPQVHHMWTSGVVNKKTFFTFFLIFYFLVLPPDPTQGRHLCWLHSEGQGALPLKDKLLEEAILGAIRAAKESFRESSWLSYCQDRCPPPFGAAEEQEQRDFKAFLRIFHQAPDAEFINPPPSKCANQ